MTFTADKIRNILLAGHGGSGKTALAEAMLFKSGATERMGSTGFDFAVKMGIGKIFLSPIIFIKLRRFSQEVFLQIQQSLHQSDF